MKTLDLNAVVASFFDANAPLACIPFGNGHINDTYHLSIPEGVFLLQKINKSIFPNANAVMENMYLVAKHLQTKGHPLVLMPKLTITGELFHTDRTGNAWRVLPFFEHTRSFDVVENESQAYEAARAFGAFTAALHDLELQKLHYTIPNFHSGIHREQQFQKAIANAVQERISRSEKSIHFISKNSKLFGAVASLSTPLRVTHNDTKINNVLFDSKGKKALAVIDWDTIMPGHLLADFGDLVRTAANAGKEDEGDLDKVFARKEIIEALTAGYMEALQGIITKVECDNLLLGARWITLMQAMRFLTDYLSGDVYYKISYPEHNLVRARNQIRLFQTLS